MPSPISTHVAEMHTQAATISTMSAPSIVLSAVSPIAQMPIQ